MEKAPPPVLVVSDLRKAYGAVSVVKGVSFSIRAGEFLTLLGESGSGKSTTLRIIAGLESPSGGTIRLRGREVASSAVSIPPERRNLGLVFQSYAIWPHMTVGENVSYPLRMRGVARAEAQERVKRMCALVGLGGLIDRPSTALSGGQQQRVALARALIYEPDLLLLDEPLSNLDAKLRDELKAQIKSIQTTLKTSVLYVTHDQSEAMTLSDRVAVMRDGVIEQLDAPSAVYESPTSYFVQRFVGKTVEFIGGVDRSDAAGSAVRIDSTDELFEVSQSAGAGEKVRIVVRPEDIEVVPKSAPSRPNTLTARIRRVAYGGDRWECLLEAAGAEFYLELKKGLLPVPDDHIVLHFPPEKIRLWPNLPG